jgi:hypothetical protein
MKLRMTLGELGMRNIPSLFWYRVLEEPSEDGRPNDERETRNAKRERWIDFGTSSSGMPMSFEAREAKAPLTDFALSDWMD